MSKTDTPRNFHSVWALPVTAAVLTGLAFAIFFINQAHQADTPLHVDDVTTRSYNAIPSRRAPKIKRADVPPLPPMLPLISLDEPRAIPPSVAPSPSDTLITLPPPVGGSPASIALLDDSQTKQSTLLKSAEYQLSLDELPAAAAADPALQSAFVRWCDASRAGRILSKADTDKLIETSSESMLNASTLVAIATGVKKIPSNHSLLVGTLAANAAVQLHRDLPKYGKGASDYAKMLHLLIQTKGLLWHAIERGGNKCFVPQQLTICNDLSLCDPGTDPTLQNAKIHGYIGGAECLYLLKRPEESLKKLDTISQTTRLNDEQRASIAWARGLVLFQARRYNEALPFLNTTAETRGHQHANDAATLLCDALAALGDRAKAKSTAGKFLKTFPNNKRLGYFAASGGGGVRLNMK